jgi:hypothetical protein
MVRREGPAREVEVERIRQGLDLFDNYLWISDLQHLVNPSVTIQLGQGVMNQFGTGVHEPSNQEVRERCITPLMPCLYSHCTSCQSLDGQCVKKYISCIIGKNHKFGYHDVL